MSDPIGRVPDEGNVRTRRAIEKIAEILNDLTRRGQLVLDASGKWSVVPGGAALGEAAEAATTLGSVVARIPVYDSGGTLVGYLPVFDSIT